MTQRPDRVRRQPWLPILLLFLLTVAIPAEGLAQVELIGRGSTWKFFAENQDLGTDWVDPDFDDSTWGSGPAQLGYSEGDEATLVSRNGQITTYFRMEFDVDLGQIPIGDELVLEILRDDGAVCYINGQEVVRSNMPAGAISFDTLASTAAGGANEDSFFPFVVGRGRLLDGRNVIAVSVHQISVGSSDMSFDLGLFSGVASTPPSVVEAEKLIPSDVFTSRTGTQPGAGMGSSVAISDGTLLLGAAGVSVGQGALYAFEPSTEIPGTHVEIQKIRGSMVNGGFANFGRTCAADGDTLVIGSPQDSVEGEDNRELSGAGTVYVFEREADRSWREVAALVASDARSNRFFGFDVAIDGDTIVVGASRNDGPGSGYVFERNAKGEWNEVAILRPAPGRSPSGFGAAVSVSGDLVAVGAGQRGSSKQAPGSVFLYGRRSGAGQWGHVRTIVAPAGRTDNRFGTDLILRDDTLAVTALRDGSALNPSSAVYIFEKDAGGVDEWGSTAKLVSGTNEFDDFGIGLDIKDNLLVAGARRFSRAHIFARNLGGTENWGYVGEIGPSDEGHDPQTGQSFGQAVAIGEGKIVVGSNDNSAGLNRGGGAVYVFNFTRGAPVVGRPLQDTVRLIRQTVEFDSDAVGPGDLRYQWFRDGVALERENSATLRIEDLSSDDSGFYSAVISNGTGSIETRQAHLRVRDKLAGSPTISVGTNSRQAGAGDQYTRGYAFSPREEVYATHLGIHDVNGDGFAVPVEVGLWDRSTRALLARVKISRPGTAEVMSGFYRYAPIEAVRLVPGRQYVTGAFSQFAYPIITSAATLQVDPEINVLGGFVTRNLTMEMPDESENFENLRVQASVQFSRVLPPQIQVRDGSDPGSPLLGGLIDFGTATAGTAGVERTFLVENLGGEPLVLDSLILPAGIQLVGGFPATIAPDDSAALVLRLSSDTPLQLVGRVKVATNDAVTNPISFAVIGQVVAMPPDRVVEIVALRNDPVPRAGEPGTMIPEGAMFRTFNRAALNESGDLLFEAAFDVSQNWGLFTNASGVLQPIAVSNGPPLDEEEVGRFSALAINDGGQTIFQTQTVSGPAQYLGASVAASVGGEAPETGAGLFAHLHQPALDSSGEKFHPAHLTRETGTPNVTRYNDTGIWGTGSGLIAREGDPSPLAGFDYGHISSRIVVTDGGQIVFASNLSPAPGAAIFAGSVGALQTIAMRGQAAPGTDRTFAGFSAESVNSGGDIVFRANLSLGDGVSSANNDGLWTNRSGQIELVAREAGIAPLPKKAGSVRFDRFADMAISDAGTIFFFAYLAGDGIDSANDGSLWRFDSSGGLTLIAREGDPAIGTPYEFVQLSAFVSNSSGGVAFLARLSGGGGESATEPGIGVWFDQGIIGSGPVLVLRSGDRFELGPEDLRGVVAAQLHGQSNPYGGSGGYGRKLNSAGKLVLGLTLSGNSSGVFLIDAPEHAGGLQPLFADKPDPKAIPKPKFSHHVVPISPRQIKDPNEVAAKLRKSGASLKARSDKK